MNKTDNPTVQRLMEFADNYADAPEFPHLRQILEAELTRLLTPLSDEQIAQCGVEHQMFFAKGFGSAPGSWTNEQVRTCCEFQSAFLGIARAVEIQHGIEGES